MRYEFIPDRLQLVAGLLSLDRAAINILTAGGVDTYIHYICPQQVEEALNLPAKDERNQAIAALRKSLAAELEEQFPDSAKDIGDLLRELEKKAMRRQILDRGERVDGRKVDEIRSISSEVGVLPRTHGSALFTRGQTQALCVATLGTVRDEQRID